MEPRELSTNSVDNSVDIPWLGLKIQLIFTLFRSYQHDVIPYSNSFSRLEKNDKTLLEWKRIRYHDITIDAEL